jgi:FkbM family methyltransferase
VTCSPGAGRRLLTGVVSRLPPAAVAPLRRAPVRPALARPVLRMARELLGRGGIPRAVATFALADNPELSFVNADSLVLRQLYWFGEQGWEPELLPWWRYLCRRAASILELGANVGYFTVQGARAAPRARYVAVEPHPVSLRVCRENLALNGIHSVRLLGAAATPDHLRPTTELIIPRDQLRTPTVAFLPGGSELPRQMAGRAATAIEVPAVDVRSLLDGVDLLKIDAEGQEHALLEAAWPQLRTFRPALLVEVLPGTRRLRDLLARLCTELGYRCYVPQGSHLVPLPPARLAGVHLQREYATNDLVLDARGDLPGEAEARCPEATTRSAVSPPGGAASPGGRLRRMPGVRTRPPLVRRAGAGRTSA